MKRYIKIKNIKKEKDILKNINKRLFNNSTDYKHSNNNKSKYNNKLINNIHSKNYLLLFAILFFFNLKTTYEICPNNMIVSPFDNSTCEPKECPKEYPYLNKSNECVDNCDSIDFDNKECLIHYFPNFYNNIFLKTIILPDLKNEINNDISENSTKHENIFYTIETSENQKNLNYECEVKIKEEYNINKNESLIIKKKNTNENGIIIYEIYHPKINATLNLEICKKYKKEILIPLLYQMIFIIIFYCVVKNAQQNFLIHTINFYSKEHVNAHYMKRSIYQK